jgi:hypothetical protein
VSVKHGKNKYPDVDLDPEASTEEFKALHEDKRSTVGRTAHAKACGPFLFPPDWARGGEKNG